MMPIAGFVAAAIVIYEAFLDGERSISSESRSRMHGILVVDLTELNLAKW
jgi:hypothetical protein